MPDHTVHVLDRLCSVFFTRETSRNGGSTVTNRQPTSGCIVVWSSVHWRCSALRACTAAVCLCFRVCGCCACVSRSSLREPFACAAAAAAAVPSRPVDAAVTVTVTAATALCSSLRCCRRLCSADSTHTHSRTRRSEPSRLPLPQSQPLPSAVSARVRCPLAAVRPPRLRVAAPPLIGQRTASLSVTCVC